jgi:hypothetical protein
MNQESLQNLFSEIKNSPSESSINEVSGWLDKASVVTTTASAKTFSLTTKIISMISMIAIAVSATIYFTSDDTYVDQRATATPAENKSTSTTLQTTRLKDSIKKEGSIIVSVSQLVQEDSVPAKTSIYTERSPVETEEASQIKRSDLSENPQVSFTSSLHTNEVDSGMWKSINDSLFIDTVFNGVKKLIFSGVINNKIVVRGSQRNNVSMNYSYKYKAKGIFVGKSNCKVSFNKVDSVLTIRVERNATVNVGVSYTKMSSNITFEVPENISIDVNTSFGDIEIKELRANDFYFKTAYGDIQAHGIQGNTVFNTSYGDIKLDTVSGNIVSKTSYGDIKGVHITGAESIEFKSGYGDINFLLANPISDCRLELKTGYGNIKVRRNDLEIESGKKLSFGTGRVKVLTTTGYGDVIIK